MAKKSISVLGVILARGGSKGIPKKNIYNICGHPLISYTITAGLRSKYIDDLVVSTDSRAIADVSRRYGAKVPFMRPDELAGDTVLSVDALRHAVLEAEKSFGKKYDYVIELPCVAPLRDHDHIDETIEKIVEKQCDSVISVCDTGEKHPVRLKKIVDDRIEDFCTEYPEPAAGSRRQDLFPKSYIRNGAIYLMSRETIVENNSRHGRHSLAYIMPTEKSINIDEPLDIKIAQLIIEEGGCTNRPHKGDKWLITTPMHFLEEAKQLAKQQAHCNFVEHTRKGEIIESLKDAHVWICNPCPKYIINEEMLGGAQNLRVIASTSTGTNHIDKRYCEERGIRVISLKDIEGVRDIKASSEFTFNLLLSVMRKTPFAFNSVLNGAWREKEDEFRGVEINGKSIGIVGYGRIGSNNARYAKAFGMNVFAYDPNVDISDEYVTQCSSAYNMLPLVDVVLICVHLDNNTRNMVDNTWFKQMKDGVYFINTSRGEVVNEKDLFSNLVSGKIKAAGLDVLTDELTHNISTNPLVEYARTHSNLIITPHIAGLTYESELKAAKLIIESVIKGAV